MLLKRRFKYTANGSSVLASVAIATVLSLALTLFLLHFQLSFTSSNFKEQFEKAHYRELSTADAYGISVKLNSLLSIMPVVCAVASKDNEVFYRKGTLECEASYLEKKIEVLGRGSENFEINIVIQNSESSRFFSYIFGLLTALSGYVTIFLTWFFQKKYFVQETRQKLLEQRIEEQAKRASLERQAAVGAVVQEISHDLKNPISMIQGILNVRSWEEYQNKYNYASIGLNQLLSMVDSYKHADMSIQVKKSIKYVDLALFKNRIHAVSQSKNVQLYLPEKLKIYADWEKLERAILNLFYNALESGATKIIIKVEAQDTSLSVAIFDNGPGIPEHLLDSLFKRGVTYGKPGGTGIGLAFTKSIAQGHGGDISYSRKNDQTIFEIKIPVIEKIIDSKQSLQSKKNSTSHLSSNTSFLVYVDDEQSSILELLKNHGLDSKIHLTSDESLITSCRLVVSSKNDVLVKSMEVNIQCISIPIQYSDEEIVRRIILRYRQRTDL